MVQTAHRQPPSQVAQSSYKRLRQKLLDWSPRTSRPSPKSSMKNIHSFSFTSWTSETQTYGRTSRPKRLIWWRISETITTRLKLTKMQLLWCVMCTLTYRWRWWIQLKKRPGCGRVGQAHTSYLAKLEEPFSANKKAIARTNTSANAKIFNRISAFQRTLKKN